MYQIHEGKKRVMSVAFTKANGQPGQVAGIPTWTNDTPNVLVTPTPDGMSATIAWAAPGDANVTMTANGDLTGGNFPLIVTEAFTCLPPLGATAVTDTVSDES